MQAYSLELEDPPLLPAGSGPPRSKARRATSSRLQQLGVNLTPSKLRAAHSPNGKNVRVAIQVSYVSKSVISFDRLYDVARFGYQQPLKANRSC